MNRRYIIYALTILSSIIYAIVVLLDTYIVVSIKRDIIAVSLSFFLVGSITAPLIIVIANIPVNGKKLGRYIDPLYDGLKIPNRREFLYLLVAALGNAVFSLIYFYMLRLYKDPSAMLAFISLAPIYLIFADVFVSKEMPTLIEVQGISMIAVGVILVSLTISEISLFGLMLVLVPMNLFIVIHNIGMKKLEESELFGKRMDSINVRFWLILLTTLLIYLLTSPAFGINVIFESLIASIEGFIVIFLDMTLTFLSYALYIRALAYGKMSEVNALYSINALFALIFQYMMSFYLPGIYSIILTQTLLMLKTLGIILAVVGIASLALTEVTAYVFIRVKPGYRGLFKKLISIRGVETVSATAGIYDYILRIRIRSLGQAYYIITKELDKIDGIMDYIWLTTLKEWEVF